VIMNFAFYGQATTKDRAAARLVRAHQLEGAGARVRRHGGLIVVEYFDVYPDRLTSLWHRRQARRLLQAVEGQQRPFDAVVIGDTLTALTAMQYDDLLLSCTEHGVQLWVPEVDEPVDPDSREHRVIMERVFWGH
jgi:site-specific DNA recombinase